MAEGFREWGDYGAEEEWKGRSPLKKAFSFRTLRRAVKIFCIILIVAIYGILMYRLITGLSVPSKAKTMLWTESARAAYDANGDLVVYSQDPEATFGNDGRFSIYQVKFIPETSELQFTVRFNRSTVTALKTEIGGRYAVDESADDNTKAQAEAEKEKAVSAVDDVPFAFVLRDGTYNESTGSVGGGRVYTEYSCSTFKKGLYTYVKLSFSGVELFDTDTAPGYGGKFAPGDEYADVIYKGANKSIAVSSDISYLYLDFYYENEVDLDAESWADPLLVYRSGLALNDYDVKKDLPTQSADEITKITVKESN